MLTEFSSDDTPDVLVTAADERKATVQLILIYSEAAALQMAEAEELMCVALAAREHAEALFARAADLVTQHLHVEEDLTPPVKDDYTDLW